MLVAVSLFVVMAGTAVPAWRGSRWAAALLAAEAVVWLLVDRWFEGPTLFHVTYHHGLVLADLVGLVALLVAATCLSRPRRG